MSTFDKKRCLANIYFLAKEKNIKIGDLESAAGVSAGYLSRINKEESETNPSIELLISVSQTLGVSLDALLNYAFDKQTSTEVFLLKFVEKLTHDTIHDERPWKRESLAYLNDLNCDQNGNVDHPLFSLYDPYEQTYSSIRYISHFEDNPGSGDVTIYGDCFNTQLPDGSRVYLMRVIYTPVEQTGYELYLINNSGISSLCDDNMQGGFEEALANLYSAATESCKHIKINTATRNIIDAYMTGKNIVPSDDDLPF